MPNELFLKTKQKKIRNVFFENTVWCLMERGRVRIVEYSGVQGLEKLPKLN